MGQLLLYLDLTKAWSESAREAAIEARRAARAGAAKVPVRNFSDRVLDPADREKYIKEGAERAAADFQRHASGTGKEAFERTKSLAAKYEARLQREEEQAATRRPGFSEEARMAAQQAKAEKRVTIIRSKVERIDSLVEKSKSQVEKHPIGSPDRTYWVARAMTEKRASDYWTKHQQFPHGEGFKQKILVHQPTFDEKHQDAFIKGTRDGVWSSRQILHSPRLTSGKRE